MTGLAWTLAVLAVPVLVALLLPAMAWAWRRLLCPHAWAHVDRVDLPSRLEEMEKFGRPVVMWSGDWIRCARKTVAVVVGCPKCGASKVIRESN